MTQEEIYLNSRMKRENHFRVPDGYFDQLTASVMSRLPEQEQQEQQPKQLRSYPRTTVPSYHRILLYAAAVVAVAIVCVSVYFNRYVAPQEAEEPVTAAATVSDSYIDEAADYMMMDHQDIYACLTSDY